MSLKPKNPEGTWCCCCAAVATYLAHHFRYLISALLWALTSSGVQLVQVVLVSYLLACIFGGCVSVTIYVTRCTPHKHKRFTHTIETNCAHATKNVLSKKWARHADIQYHTKRKKKICTFKWQRFNVENTVAVKLPSSIVRHLAEANRCKRAREGDREPKRGRSDWGLNVVVVPVCWCIRNVRIQLIRLDAIKLCVFTRTAHVFVFGIAGVFGVQ